jgi:hypothetical protein
MAGAIVPAICGDQKTICPLEPLADIVERCRPGGADLREPHTGRPLAFRGPRNKAKVMSPTLSRNRFRRVSLAGWREWSAARIICAALLSTRPRVGAWLIGGGLAAIPAIGWGDVFVLKSGGQVEGEWINRDDRRDAMHEIRTPSGIRLKVASAALATRIPQPAADEEYQRIAPTFGNTVEEQWELAQWCRDNDLSDRREVHLKAVVALDTDHVPARRALGYQQFRGEWQTREQHHRRDGYELYRGRWRLVQDIEIQEEAAKNALIAKQWLVRLKHWRAELFTERAPLAYQRFAQLRDPAAVPALQTLLAWESERRIKIMYLDALERIGDPAAVNGLLIVALNDADHEIFLECADRLKKLPSHRVFKPLVNALADKSNLRVNRAAYMLGKLDDPQCVSPLIDALVSVYRVIQKPGVGETTSSFRSDGQTESSDTLVIDVAVQNRYVLEALTELTGQNFDYDQGAWRRWYNIEKERIFAESTQVGLRRQDSEPRPR